MELECPSSDDLNLYAAGLLDDDQSKAMETHVSECNACKSLLTNLAPSSDALIEALQTVSVAAELTESCRTVLEHSARLALSEHGRTSSTAATVTPTHQQAAAPSLVANDPRQPSPGADERLHGNSHTNASKLIGPYELLEQLGAGGMGTVFKGRHGRLGKLVAVKLLTANRGTHQNSQLRFEREMKAIGQLDHPNVVHAFDAGIDDGTHFLAMELLSGMDLGELEPPDSVWKISDACEALRQAALGIAYAHERGLIHRDIKPSNLFLTRHGIIKVLDLGLARMTDDSSADGLSDSFTILGTIDFMAPEQANDCRSADVKSDIYSLAATLFRLLTGEPPVKTLPESTPIQRLLTLSTSSPRSARMLRKDIPSELNQLIDRCLERKPADRISSAQEFARKLELFCNGANLVHLAENASLRISKQDEMQRLDAARHQPPLARGLLSDKRKSRATIRVAAAAFLCFVVSLPFVFRTKRPAADHNLAAARNGIETDSTESPSDKKPESTDRTSQNPQEKFASDHDIPIEFVNSIGMKFRLIPPGEFVMGSQPQEIELLLDEASREGKPQWLLDNIKIEGPAHRVCISRPFYFAIYETKVSEFRKMVEAAEYTPESIKDGVGGTYNGNVSNVQISWELPFPDTPAKDDEPVRQVTWNDGQFFCRWLSSLEQRKYRLPTEAEWEYACRAGTTTRFYTGETLTIHQARIMNESPVVVGQFPANPWGVFDMLGNVCEWCLDQIGVNYADQQDAVDPLEVSYPGVKDRVIRGGAAFYVAPRSAERRGALPSFRADTIGFRVVCEVLPNP